MNERVPEHQCEWQAEAVMLRARVAELELIAGRVAELEPIAARVVELEPLAARVADLDHQLDILKRQLFGKKSEKQLAPYKPPRPPVDPVATQKKRHDNAAARDSLPTDDIVHPLPPQACACPKCGGVVDRPMPPKISEEIELVEAHFRRRRHIREVMACRCGQYIAEAPAPPRVFEGCHYGPTTCAHAIVAKCCDALPLYRLSKMFARIGVAISDRTLGDLFHRCAHELKPVWVRLMELIAQSDLVLADETPVPVMAKDKTKRAYMWTFLAALMIGFRFSPSRSGDTPRDVLGATTGTLVVDAYTGYNAVCTVEQRERAGCLAHMRRKFADSRKNDPVAAAKALELILDVYLVEHEATALGIVRTPAHRDLRQRKSKPAMDKLRAWLDEQSPLHLPQSPMGKAISYAINQWPALIVFLTNPAVPVDNNASERALRIVALGRKNWMFVGNDVAGENMAVLMSLVRTCEAMDVNPQAYLADVLMRVGSHPQSRIDELLPQNWRPAAAA